MPRRMSDPLFREAQWSSLRLPHIAPVTALVDRMRADKGLWAPYVAPLCGGVEARLLTLLRDPGPKTRDEGGSGMLCIENDDSSAELQSEMFAAAGIAHSEFIPWNAYPWYINRSPTPAELGEGVGPLLSLIELLPRLTVVLLQGAAARDSWRRALKADPALYRRRLHVVESYHPSRQALWHKDPIERERRAKDRTDKMGFVAELLRED